MDHESEISLETRAITTTGSKDWKVNTLMEK